MQEKKISKLKQQSLRFGLLYLSEVHIPKILNPSIPIMQPGLFYIDPDASILSPDDVASCFLCVGAHIVGINCHFDPETCVKTVKMMKAGVEKAGLKAHYMSQPLAYHTPDCNRQGFIDLPEFPFSTHTL